jgi:hypothetical protein
MRPTPRPIRNLRFQRSELEDAKCMIHGSRDGSNGLVTFPRPQMFHDLLDDLICPAPGSVSCFLDIIILATKAGLAAAKVRR